MKKIILLLLSVHWTTLPCKAQDAKVPQDMRQASLQKFAECLQRFREKGDVGDLAAAERTLDNRNGLQAVDQYKSNVLMLAAIEARLATDDQPQPRIYNRVPPPAGHENIMSPDQISDLKVREKYLKDIADNNARAGKWHNLVHLRRYKEFCLSFFTKSSTLQRPQSQQFKTELLKAVEEARLSPASKTTLREVLTKMPVKGS